MSALVERSLGDFTDKEIREEYVGRFGEDDVDLSKVKVHALIDELEDRDALPQRELRGIEEFANLIAEAARTSRHAAKAYDLLREYDEAMPSLAVRQMLIAGRMAEVA